MKKKRLSSSVILILTGVALILFAGGAAVFTQMKQAQGKKKAENLLGRIEAVMPERSPGYKDNDKNPAMPSMEIDGEEIIGLIEIPAYDMTLPLCGTWNSKELKVCPRRYTGSVFSEALVIGGGQQFNFLSSIALGEKAVIVDMDGHEFTYCAMSIEYVNKNDTERLISENDLTLFTHRPFSNDFVAVRFELS